MDQDTICPKTQGRVPRRPYVGTRCVCLGMRSVTSVTKVKYSPLHPLHILGTHYPTAQARRNIFRHRASALHHTRTSVRGAPLRCAPRRVPRAAPSGREFVQLVQLLNAIAHRREKATNRGRSAYEKRPARGYVSFSRRAGDLSAPMHVRGFRRRACKRGLARRAP